MKPYHIADAMCTFKTWRMAVSIAAESNAPMEQGVYHFGKVEFVKD